MGETIDRPIGVLVRFAGNIGAPIIEVHHVDESGAETQIWKRRYSSAQGIPKNLPAVVRSSLDYGIANVIVDLSGVGFMDSKGVGYLAGLHRCASENGAGMFLAAVDERVENTLEAVGMSRLFPKAESVEEAIRQITHADDGNRD